MPSSQSHSVSPNIYRKYSTAQSAMRKAPKHARAIIAERDNASRQIESCRELPCLYAPAVAEGVVAFLGAPSSCADSAVFGDSLQDLVNIVGGPRRRVIPRLVEEHAVLSWLARRFVGTPPWICSRTAVPGRRLMFGPSGRMDGAKTRTFAIR